MKLKLLFYVVFLVSLCCSLSLGQRPSAPVSKIISQPNSPVKINSYSTRYEESSRYTTEGIHHSLEYENSSLKNVVAIQFGLVSFDIWNEYLDRTGGVSMSSLAPAAKNKGEWVSSRYAGFSFHTGVAYVSKVRFDDDEIWEADITAILLEMKKIEKDFDVSRLKKKDDGKP